VRLSLIAAVAENGVIGRGGRVPWHLPEDLRHFRETTWGHPCLMGRRTWESLGGPLVGRRNLVLTRTEGYTAPGAELLPSLETALALFEGTGEELFVCGGGELYRAAMPLADRLYLTRVEGAFEGDTLFPCLPEGLFREVSRREAQTEPPCSFVFLERVR